ncbi:MAG: pyruvate synthase, partial [Crenarchaeota archaeon]|nr:pyruvate synthase [Thermoproteota archaeon]
APIVNTSMLGALVRASKVVGLDSIMEAVKDRFSDRPHVIEPNLRAIKEAYEKTEVVCL